MTTSRYLENEPVHISANRVLGVDSIHKFGIGGARFFIVAKTTALKNRNTKEI